jgi:hypothetical protein
MRFRYWAMIGLAMALVVVAGCRGDRPGQGFGTPVPTKTLRPTFTYTPAVPTAVPPTATPEIPPTATPEPASPMPEAPTSTPTPEKAAFTVTGTTVNVRGGPGTAYPRVGQLRAGQTFEITGKNATGDWWQFDLNGQPAWVVGNLVSATTTGNVEVATNIPAPPATPKPRPTPRPAPAQPTQPPPVANLFGQAGAEVRNADDTNFNIVTFWGRLGRTSDAAPTSSGYKMRVSTPSGSGEVPFLGEWQWAYGGFSNKFLYNAKLELPRTTGEFRAVVVDGSGKEVSDAITGTLIDRSHDVIMNWWKR